MSPWVLSSASFYVTSTYWSHSRFPECFSPASSLTLPTWMSQGYWLVFSERVVLSQDLRQGVHGGGRQQKPGAATSIEPPGPCLLQRVFWHTRLYRNPPVKSQEEGGRCSDTLKYNILSDQSIPDAATGSNSVNAFKQETVVMSYGPISHH